MTRKLIFLICILLFNSCYTTFKTVPSINDLDENVIFKIDQVEEGYAISTGSGHYYPSKGNKFVFVFMTFTNKSSVKQVMNFENIYLLDNKNEIKHKIEFSMLTGAINIWGKLDPSIKSNDTKSRKLVFSFPKEMKAEYLLVNNRIIPIVYQ